MSTCDDVGSFIESKTSVVQTSNVGFTSEVSDYLVVYTGPGRPSGKEAAWRTADLGLYLTFSVPVLRGFPTRMVYLKHDI